MDELIAFVRQQLDVEEDLARRVAVRYTVRNPDREDDGQPYWPLPSVERNFNFRSDDDIAAGLDLIKLYNPARVRAEVKATRAILDEFDKALARRKEHREDLANAGALLMMVRIVKLLAQPYAGQPGWREEWRA